MSYSQGRKCINIRDFQVFILRERIYPEINGFDDLFLPSINDQVTIRCECECSVFSTRTDKSCNQILI